MAFHRTKKQCFLRDTSKRLTQPRSIRDNFKVTKTSCRPRHHSSKLKAPIKHKASDPSTVSPRANEVEMIQDTTATPAPKARFPFLFLTPVSGRSPASPRPLATPAFSPITPSPSSKRFVYSLGIVLDDYLPPLPQHVVSFSLGERLVEFEELGSLETHVVVEVYNWRMKKESVVMDKRDEYWTLSAEEIEERLGKEEQEYESRMASTEEDWL